MSAATSGLIEVGPGFRFAHPGYACYRTVTFYTGKFAPVYLLTVFGKGEKANLSKAESNVLRTIAKALVQEHSERIARAGRRKGART